MSTDTERLPYDPERLARLLAETEIADGADRALQNAIDEKRLELRRIEGAIIEQQNNFGEVHPDNERARSRLTIEIAELRATRSRNHPRSSALMQLAESCSKYANRVGQAGARVPQSGGSIANAEPEAPATAAPPPPPPPTAQAAPAYVPKSNSRGRWFGGNHDR